MKWKSSSLSALGMINFPSQQPTLLVLVVRLRVATSALVFSCRMIDLVDTVSVAELGLARSLAPQAQFDSASSAAAAANKVNEKMFI